MAVGSGAARNGKTPPLAKGSIGIGSGSGSGVGIGHRVHLVVVVVVVLILLFLLYYWILINRQRLAVLCGRVDSRVQAVDERKRQRVGGTRAVLSWRKG